VFSKENNKFLVCFREHQVLESWLSLGWMRWNLSWNWELFLVYFHFPSS
jgi:hypothetical protein